MSMGSMSNACEHGQLARVCNICELTARVKELEQQLESSKREWQGLTDEEKAELDAEYGDDTLAHLDAIEAKLKEKNT